MDNLDKENQTQGEGDVASSSGQSAEETQPKEAEVEETGATEGADTNPWEENPKFKGKTPVDIYKAYQEAEKQLGTLGKKAEIANLIEEKYGVSPEELKSRIEDMAQQSQDEYYKSNPESYLQDRLSRQEREIALMKEEKELESFLRANPDYEPFKDKLMRIALSAERDKTYEDIAKDYFGGAIAQGQQSAYKKIDEKKQTQTSPTGSKEAVKPSLDDINKLPPEEAMKVLETILPSRE